LDVGQVIVVDWEGNPDPDPTRIGYTMIDFDFFETFEMPIVRGRALSAAFPQDETESCIINETAAKMFGGEDPIGRMLYWSQGAIDPKLRNVRIVGVVKDFYDRSLREGIRPFIFRKYLPWLQFAFIKVDKNRISEVLPAIRETFEKFFPDHLFGYEFLDDAFNRQYRNETQQGRLFNVFSLLAIVIAALGLFGLAAFTAQKKIKELGIRKVLGASVSELVILMVKEYLVWIAVANAAAWTAAFFFLRQWLNQFAQRVPLDPLVFPLASAAMLVVVLSVVGVQTVRAARANPVDALRVE
jgi:putative ABC transport system permease protein